MLRELPPPVQRGKLLILKGEELRWELKSETDNVTLRDQSRMLYWSSNDRRTILVTMRYIYLSLLHIFAFRIDHRWYWRFEVTTERIKCLATLIIPYHLPKNDRMNTRVSCIQSEQNQQYQVGVERHNCIHLLVVFLWRRSRIEQEYFSWIHLLVVFLWRRSKNKAGILVESICWFVGWCLKIRDSSRDADINSLSDFGNPRTIRTSYHVPMLHKFSLWNLWAIGCGTCCISPRSFVSVGRVSASHSNFAFSSLPYLNWSASHPVPSTSSYKQVILPFPQLNVNTLAIYVDIHNQCIEQMPPPPTTSGHVSVQLYETKPVTLLNDCYTKNHLPPFGKHLIEFSIFPNLPVDISSAIWTCVLQCHRLITINVIDKGNTTSPTKYLPSLPYMDKNGLGNTISGKDYRLSITSNHRLHPLLQVCGGSRRAALEFYRLHIPYDLKVHGERRCLYLNPEFDFLHVKQQGAPELFVDLLHDAKAYDPRGVGIQNIGVGDPDDLQLPMSTKPSGLKTIPSRTYLHS